MRGALPSPPWAARAARLASSAPGRARTARAALSRAALRRSRAGIGGLAAVASTPSASSVVGGRLARGAVPVPATCDRLANVGIVVGGDDVGDDDAHKSGLRVSLLFEDANVPGSVFSSSIPNSRPTAATEKPTNRTLALAGRSRTRRQRQVIILALVNRPSRPRTHTVAPANLEWWRHTAPARKRALRRRSGCRLWSRSRRPVGRV